MRLDDTASFAAGLDLEEVWCPLSLVVAARLFWVAAPILLPAPRGDDEAVDVPPATAATILDEGEGAVGTLH